MSAPPSASPAPATRIAARVQELSPEGPRRRFLIVIPAARIAALHAARLAELGLASGSAPRRLTMQPAWTPQLRERVAASALADACRKASEEALGAILPRLPVPIVGKPQLDTLAGPPDGDLILRAEIWTLPEVTLPDPAALHVERLVALPDPAEEQRALAALAATRATLAEQPPGTPAEPGDELVCDVAAVLLPAENRIPQPSLAGAAPGSPGRLPDGWSFGDNGAGLAAEVLAVDTTADPPHLRLRVRGTANADGQSFVIFHPARAIAATAGTQYVGSVLLRPVGAATGLRGAKLRLESQPSSGEGALRRKDAALALRPGAEGFARCYVSDRMMEAATAFLRLPLLFDHAAGAVDFCLDIAQPRLVEGLDLGEQATVPLPEFAGRGRRFEIGKPDPLALEPHLAGIAVGATREVTLRLSDSLEDRALAGRQARFTVRTVALRRRVVPPVDAALAHALGHADVAALRGFVAGRVAAHHAALADRAARRAVLDALLAAAGDFAVPAPALQQEIAALRARLPGAAPGTVAAQAARRLRIGLLLGALARRHGLSGEDQAIAYLLAQAQVTQRSVPATELAAAATA